MPEKTPSMRWILSPVAIRSLSVDMIGRPAPTVDSWYISPACGFEGLCAEEKISFHSLKELLKAFLFGVTTLMPCFRKSG